MSTFLSPATPQGFLYLWMRTRVDHAKAQPDRGASAIEWVIITAVLVGLAAGIGAIIYQLVTDAANEIEIPDAPG